MGRNRFPIGDVINYGVYYNADVSPQYTYAPTKGYEHMAAMQLWWTDERGVQALMEAVKEWFGFTLHVGMEGSGSSLMPEVIEEDWQERAYQGAYTVGTKGDDARVGDRLVWLEIDDPDEAMRTMDARSDIPCAVRCDVFRYSTDNVYKRAYLRALDYFVNYYITGSPMRIKDTSETEDDVLKEIYGA